MNNRSGCLGGLFKLFALNWIFDFLQERFGFGRGLSCSGIGCGLILMVIFIVLACGIIGNTDWFKLWSFIISW